MNRMGVRIPFRNKMGGLTQVCQGFVIFPDHQKYFYIASD